MSCILGSNDPAAYMLTIILLTSMKQGVSSRLPLQILTTAATQILFGLAIGAVLAFVVRWVLLHVDFETSGNILTTFSDYSEETDVRFIDIPVTEHHPWNGMKVRDLQLPPGTLLVFLSHPGEKNTIPHGETVLRAGDVLVLGATAYTGQEDIHLSKLTLDASHPWCSRQIKDLKLSPGNLIILIRRNGQTIIPRGDTILEPGDELVKTS